MLPAPFVTVARRPTFGSERAPAPNSRLERPQTAGLGRLVAGRGLRGNNSGGRSDGCGCCGGGLVPVVLMMA